MHFFVADGALSGFFFAGFIDVERIEEFFCIFGVAEEQFEFAGVEPDAGTFGAVVDLYTFKLESNHSSIFANWTIHE